MTKSKVTAGNGRAARSAPSEIMLKHSPNMLEVLMAEFMYADRIPAEILAWGNELAQIRRDIHQHPELGFDTSRTCGVIAQN